MANEITMEDRGRRNRLVSQGEKSFRGDIVVQLWNLIPGTGYKMEVVPEFYSADLWTI